MAGLWSVALGFSEQRLIDAAMRQFKALPFYHQFTHKTHEMAAQFAKQLIEACPVPMSKVFFTNSGSEANDTVVKLVWYHSNALGLPHKKKIISRQRGYHGVTIASASLTGLVNNHKGFDLPIAGILHTSCPHYWRDGQAGEPEEQYADRMVQDLEDMILREGADTVAGGVIVPPATYWEKIQRVLKKYDILFIVDEVICGFGRTGNLFASTTFNLEPDVIVLSKQISSSYQPLSAILLNDKVFEPIADESNKLGVLGHGFTTGGHPVAVAVGIENLNIIQERNLVEHAAKVGEHMLKRLRELEDHPMVGEIRGIGLIAAVEFVADKAQKKGLETPGQLGLAVGKEMQNKGVIVRNIADAVAFCPPLIITEEQVDVMVDALRQAIDTVYKQWFVK